MKKVFRFIRKNYILSLFILCLILVGSVAFVKIIGNDDKYVFVRMKVGSGYWWTATAKPPSWYSTSVKKGDTAFDVLGNPIARVIEVRKYPSAPLGPGVGSQYDQYITLKIKASENRKSGQLMYNRVPLSTGSPIELEFSTTNIDGTIIEVSRNPFSDKYEERTVTLVNQAGYNKDFPYRFDAVKIGDKYSDGVDTVFEVTDKKLEKNIWTIADNTTGQIYEHEIATTQNIIITARVRVKVRPEGYFYGEEYKVGSGLFVPFSTKNYYLENFIIRAVE